MGCHLLIYFCFLIVFLRFYLKRKWKIKTKKCCKLWRTMKLPIKFYQFIAFQISFKKMTKLRKVVNSSHFEDRGWLKDSQKKKHNIYSSNWIEREAVLRVLLLFLHKCIMLILAQIFWWFTFIQQPSQCATLNQILQIRA